MGRGVSLAIVATAALLAGCGGSYGSGPNKPPSGNGGTPPTNGVSVVNNAFQPTALTVTAGATVKWVWNSCTSDGYYNETCVAHNVTFTDGTASPTQQQGSYSRTFATRGTFGYYCSVHGSAAASDGTIVVQ